MNNYKVLASIYFFFVIICSNSLAITDHFYLHKKIKIDDSREVISGISVIILDNENNIYIHDKSTIYKYDSNGKYINAIIRHGSGPNEIQLVQNINLNEKQDSLVIYDTEKAKITIFSLNGKYINTLDSPIKKMPFMLVSNNMGDYYLYSRGQKGDCLIHHLDKDFAPHQCFFEDNGIHEKIKGFGIMFINIDFDSAANVYVMDTLEYNIQIFNKEGKYIKSISDPSDNYNKIKKDPPTQRNLFNKWWAELSLIYPFYVLENKALIVFYKDNKKDARKYYDLYTLDGKRFGSGIIENDLKPIGKDRQGRLICSKSEISSDGTTVSHYIYIYSLKSDNNK